MQPAVPPPAAAPDAGLDFDAALADAGRLSDLLAQEFEALRAQDFDRLESLQGPKIDLLSGLRALSQQVAALPEPPPAWAAVTEAVARCREEFLRNEQLVRRQRQVVGDALGAMQRAEDGTPAPDLYDRLGQMKLRGGARLYSEV